MKRVKLDNVYESPIPPSDIKVLWADKDENTGDLRAIHRYCKNGWEPYLVSVDYIKPDEVPDGFTNALRKSFQVGSYKTFVQQYNGVAYNVVGILNPDVLESVGYVTTYSNKDIAVADDKDKNESVIVTGDLTMTYDYPIRIIFTPNFDEVWEERQTINKPLQVSVTLY